LPIFQAFGQRVGPHTMSSDSADGPEGSNQGRPKRRRSNHTICLRDLLACLRNGQHCQHPYVHGVLPASHPSSFVWPLIPSYRLLINLGFSNIFSRPSLISSEIWVCLRHNPIRLGLLDSSTISSNNTSVLTSSIFVKCDDTLKLCPETFKWGYFPSYFGYLTTYFAFLPEESLSSSSDEISVILITSKLLVSFVSTSNCLLRRLLLLLSRCLLTRVSFVVFAECH